MNLRYVHGLALAVPASIALFTACGGTADVGSDRSNVNGAGATTASGTGGNNPMYVPSPNAGSPGEAGSSQGGAAQGGTAQGGAAQGGTAQGGAAQGGMAGSGRAGSGTAGSGQAGSGAGGATCGGFAGFQCAANEWCDFDGPNCGAADGTGVCRQRPQACDLQYLPVCGCDGQMYGNECAANAAGTDATSDTSCFPQDGGAAGGDCRTDADCRLVEYNCGGCNCLALGPGQSPPKCADPVQCFVDSCLNKTAHCVSGSCVAQ